MKDQVQTWRTALYEEHSLRTHEGHTFGGVFADIYNYLAKNHTRINNQLNSERLSK